MGDPTDDRAPDRPPRAAMLEALSVRRNVLAGLAAGVALALLVYLVRTFELLGPNLETRQYPLLGPEGYFLLLGFVLASATAILVATALTVVSVVRLAREEV
ncbi:DUF7536 family protein [Halorarum halobium]|uniref:DUF7536 family protein n=1 Tax=Halorarum halobium TaxID=3075121 RepID=UPI003CCE42F1